MLFYRIEDKDGYGMYSTCLSEVSSNMFELDGRHPAPCNEEGLQEYQNQCGDSWKHYRYSFKSLDQLKSWVYKKKWRKQLKEDGLHLIVLNDDGFHGDTQAVYNKNTAKVVGYLDLELI